MRIRTLVSVLLTMTTALTAAAVDCRPATIQAFMEIGGPTRVIAHRGFSGEAPENTLVAIRRAIDVGADMVEVDVTMTRDGHVILLHDETLKRTTNGKGKPFKKSLAKIRRLDAGAWFAPEFAGERIPTLAETLKIVKDRVLINIEIKSEAVKHGVVPKVAALIVEHGMLDQVVVSSFSPEALRRMKTTAPDVVTASLFNKKEIAGFIWGEEISDWAHAQTLSEPTEVGRKLYWVLEKLFEDGGSWVNLSIGVLLLVWLFWDWKKPEDR